MPQMMKNLWFLHGFCASAVGADVLSERWAKVQRAFAQVCGNSLGERVCRMCGTIGVNTGRNCPSFWSLLGHSGCHFGVILGSLGLASRALGPKWLASGVLERSLGALGALGDPLGTILGRSWATYGAILGRLGAVRARLGALLWPSWAVLGPSWAVLGLPWGCPRAFGSHHDALRANPKNHRKTIGFSMILASGGSLGGEIRVSWSVLGASWGSSWAIYGHLGDQMAT